MWNSIRISSKSRQHRRRKPTQQYDSGSALANESRYFEQKKLPEIYLPIRQPSNRAAAVLQSKNVKFRKKCLTKPNNIDLIVKRVWVAEIP